MAKARLAGMARRWPDRAEIDYQLGLCERARGRDEAALAAWGRVPDNVALAPLAALARGRLAFETGRYSLAETCLERAIRSSAVTGDEASGLLGRLHWITGRHDDYRRHLRQVAERQDDPSETLRLLWSIDHDPYPIDGMTQTLESARRTAPDDDRVWLASADLATRAGRLGEANRWLDRCQRARPGDPAVWRARLAWAKAADRPDLALRSAAHLKASDLGVEQVLAVRAWMAAQAGDHLGEQTVLENLMAVDPGDTRAIERLADLAAQAGNAPATSPS